MSSDCSGAGGRAPQLRLARAALEQGDYGLVVRTLLPPEQIGSGGAGDLRDPELLLLLATAWMGQGRSDDAIACCRRLRSCGDDTLRAQARELQKVLEAPALQRPREWSLTLPDLGGDAAAMGRRLGALPRRPRSTTAPASPPPVGPTRPPFGFAVVTVLVVLLGLLLGGCGSAHTELRFAGPGRLQLSEHLQIEGSAPAPWQRRLSASLQQQGFSETRIGTELLLRGPVLPSRQALNRLGLALEQAVVQSDLTLPPPMLLLSSHNWLLALNERYELEFDLARLGQWRGLDLALELDGLSQRAVRVAAPRPVQPLRPGPGLLWPLQPGSRNQLVVHLWRWNRLGLGAVIVILVLLLSLGLQHLRRALGFGWPELPG